jgi:hypothetical protein
MLANIYLLMFIAHLKKNLFTTSSLLFLILIVVV